MKQLIKISQVKSNPNNPRLIKNDKFKKLVKSVQDFPEMLELRPIVVDENMIVLGGNMRLKACKEAGIKEVWIDIAKGLSEKQKKEFTIKDNVGFGEWEWDILANEWEQTELEGWGLDGFPFEDKVLEAEEDNFELPDEIKTDIVIGDLFEIGEHRLLCGDSTDSDLIEKLLDGKKPELLLTDPPYGIDYGNQLVKGDEFTEKTNKHGWRNFGNPEWDKSKPENGVLQYLCQITDNQIIWGGNYFTDDLPPTMGWLIWDKGQRGFSLADGEMAWTSFNNALRIKEYARAKANQEEKNHPTQKPQEIMNWCFEYADRHSKKEIKLVLDAYLGSGSTMVASHQLKRKCYGMELDPKYCQVIIDRMKKLDATLVIKRNGINIE
jgi:DNA modification methylase